MSKGKLEELKAKELVSIADDVCITMGADMFKTLFELMSTLIETEAQVLIQEDGLYLKQMDVSRVALTDMFIPASYFIILRPGQKIKELRLPVGDIKPILSRLGSGDVMEFTVIKGGKLHLEIKGKRLRAFNLPLFEPEELERRTPRVPFEVRIKTSMEGVLVAIEDASKLVQRTKSKKTEYTSAAVHLITTPMGLRIVSETDSKLYSAETTLTSGWDLMKFEGKIDQEVMLSIAYIVDVIRALSKVTNMMQIEYTKDMPLHIIAELPWKGIKLEYWFAPRVHVEAETEEAVPEKEVS